MSKAHKNLLPTFALLLAMILWSSSFIALKIAFKNYHPMVVIFGRMLIAATIFLFFIKKFKTINFRRDDLKYLFFMALCEPCLYFFFEAKALENTTASQAGMITSMLPLMVAISAGFFLKEKINKKSIAGFTISIGGACWLSISGVATESAPDPILGNTQAFIAMIFAVGYTISLKHLSGNYSILFLTAFQAFIGTIFFFPFLFLPSTVLPNQIYPLSALAVLYLGTFITLGAYGLYNFGVSKIPANKASAYISLIPVFTIFLGQFFLDEKFSTSQYIASSIIFGGLYISQSKKIFSLNVIKSSKSSIVGLIQRSDQK